MQLYLHYLQKRHTQRLIQKNFEVGDLVLLCDHPTAHGQYTLARVVEVFPDHEGSVRRVRVMTADENRLNVNLPCTRTTLDRDATKIAALESNAINSISKKFHIPDLHFNNPIVPENPIPEYDYFILLGQ